MKRKILSPVLVLIVLGVALSAQAHDPKEHMKDAKKPDCAAMKNMDHSKMDKNDPVMQAMMKQCMKDQHQDVGHGEEQSHGSDDNHKEHKMDAGNQRSDSSVSVTDSEKGPVSGLETEAAKVVTTFHKALRTGDGRLARSLLADQVTIFEGGRVERSADEYTQHHMQADMKYLKEMNIEVLEHQVQVMGTTAISKSRTHTKGKYKGKEHDNEGMETIVLEKQGKLWKIKHIHWSH